MTDDKNKLLDEPIPSSEVREREGGGGKMLSYVDGFTVRSSMNRIFGNLGWSQATLSNQLVSEEKDARGRWRISYEAHVAITIEGTGCSRTDYGHGHGVDQDKGRAIESASKEAVTDACKRACAPLGNRVGLALYDAHRTFITDTQGSKPARDSALAQVTRAVLGGMAQEVTKKPPAKKPAAKRQAEIPDTLTYSFTDGEVEAIIGQIDLAKTKDDLEPVRTRLNNAKGYSNRSILVEKFQMKKTQIESKGQAS